MRTVAEIANGNDNADKDDDKDDDADNNNDYKPNNSNDSKAIK